MGKDDSGVETGGESKASNLKSLMVLPVATLLISTLVLILLPLYNRGTLTFPITIILAVMMLVSTLVIAAVILHQLEIGCKFEALGLPAGSIRSLIALSLVIIFVMLAIYLYPELKPSVSILPSNYTVVYPNGTIVSTFNSTSVLSEPSEAQKNFSLQALTTVSTLVVAIASFYFGSKAVEAGRKATGPTTSNGKSTLSTDPAGIADAIVGTPLLVKLKNTPEDQAIDSWGIYGDPGGKLTQNEYNSFEYTPSEKAQERVLLYFGIKKNQSVKAELEVKVKEKAPNKAPTLESAKEPSSQVAKTSAKATPPIGNPSPTDAPKDKETGELPKKKDKQNDNSNVL